MKKNKERNRGCYGFGVSLILGLLISTFIIPAILFPDTFLSESWWQLWSFYIVFIAPIATVFVSLVIWVILKMLS